jgi:diguanylate cyclase (GGDEF)-like protein
LLAEVGALVRKQIRSTDLAARFGGDEYVILLPNTDKVGALTMVGKLRQTLREHRFRADDGQGIMVTASFGIAAVPEDALTKLDLMRLADQAMYRVKGTTRDAVELADALGEAI